RARPAPLAGGPGLAFPGGDPRRPARVPERAAARAPARGDRTLGVVRRLRPRGAGATVGPDDGTAARDPPVHQGPAPVVGRLRPARVAAGPGAAPRRAGGRPAQPRPLARHDR